MNPKAILTALTVASFFASPSYVAAQGCKSLSVMNDVEIRDLIKSPASELEDRCGGLLPISVGTAAIAVADGEYWLPALVDFVAWSSLTKLGYAYADIDPEIRAEAVRKFQRDAGFKAESELTFEQLRTLTRRANLYEEQRVWVDSGGWFESGAMHPITNGIAQIAENRVTVSGTWMVEVGDRLDEDRGTNPINTVRIECDQQQRTCKENNAFVTVPDPDSGAMYLNLIERVFEIVSWTDTALTAEGPSPGIPYNQFCKTVLEVTFESRQVSEYRNMDDRCTENGLIVFQPWQSSRKSRLVNGDSRTARFWTARQETARSYLSDEILEFVPPLLDNQNRN